MISSISSKINTVDTVCLLLTAADCFWTTSLDYSGTISYTVSGIPCQYWNTYSPHVISYQPEDKTARKTNYCRESTYSEGGPGCYTTNANVLWEYCFIVKCKLLFLFSV